MEGEGPEDEVLEVCGVVSRAVDAVCLSRCPGVTFFFGPVDVTIPPCRSGGGGEMVIPTRLIGAWINAGAGKSPEIGWSFPCVCEFAQRVYPTRPRRMEAGFLAKPAGARV